MLILVWVVSPAERQRRSTVERLAVGDPVDRVVGLLGEPATRCPTGALRHLEKTFPPGWPGASIQSTLRALVQRTQERWVYSTKPGRRASCSPRDGVTEIGVGRDGRIVWYVAVTGKSPLNLPEEFTPARPEGAPGS